MKIAILDDYQNFALRFADWSKVKERAEITVFDRHLKVPDEAARELQPFDAVVLLRERMAMPAELINRLPNLKFIAATGPHNRTIDYAAVNARGIPVSCTRAEGPGHQGTPELTFGLMLACMRHIPHEDRRMREGHWQSTVGQTLYGRRLGLLGLGRLGRRVAEIGKAFGMEVVAWSPNLTPEKAAEGGAKRVEKDELFRTSDVVSIHVVLGERSRGLVGARELGLMKPTAWLINTARGPIVDEAALLQALREKRIAGAGLDVYDEEPLPPDHPIRKLDNVVLTPHLGYVTEEVLKVFYADTVENILAWWDGKPLRLLNGPGFVPR
jgi:phosphoglycerate dehydrogenase-like enzyme